MAVASIVGWLMGGRNEPDPVPVPTEQRPDPIVVNNNWATLKTKFESLVWNPEKVSLDDYKRMVDEDETCYYGIEVLKTAVIRRIGEYTNVNPEHEQFVRKTLAGIRGTTFWRCLDEILDCLVYGFSATEIVWAHREGKVVIDSLQTLLPRSVWFDIGTDGPMKNRVTGVVQDPGSAQAVAIPWDRKMIIYTHNGKAGNPYGRSDLRAAYKSWFIKDHILKCWSICSEKYGTPFLIGKSESRDQVRFNGRTMSAFDYLSEILDSLGKAGVAALPTQSDIKVEYPSRNYGGDFQLFIDYLNKSIFRALSIPSLLVDNGSVGSHSLGVEHKKLWNGRVDKVSSELIDVMIEQAIKPLIEYNFGEQEDYGDFALDSSDAEEEKLLAEIEEILARNGFIDAGRLADLNKVRVRHGLDPLDESEMQPSMPDIQPLPPENAPSSFSSVSQMFTSGFASKMKKRAYAWFKAA